MTNKLTIIIILIIKAFIHLKIHDNYKHTFKKNILFEMNGGQPAQQELF
jgi:hypothetical protein